MPRSMIVTDKNVREVAEALGEYFQNILGEDWANVMHDAVAALVQPQPVDENEDEENDE